MAAENTVDLVVRATADVGEGPLWTPGEGPLPTPGRLHWVELSVGRLHVTDLADGTDVIHDLGGLLGAVVPTADGRWGAVSGDGFGWLDPPDAPTHVRLADAVTTDPALRMNDGACDGHGRFWAGSTTYGFPAGGGALHCWDGSSPSVAHDDGFALPNGIGWSPDERTMYLVDSIPRLVFAYDYDAAAGIPRNRRVLAEFSTPDGLPDGLAVDAEGCIWIAFHGGGCLRRLDPSGRVVDTRVLPVSQPTSCAFGDATALFLTSGRADLDATQLAAEPLAGSVFVLDAGVHGSPVGRFGG